MISDPIAPSFEVEGGALRVRGELGVEDEKAFEQSLGALLASNSPELIIDMSGVSYASSGYVRHIAMAIVEARQKGRSISIRASRRIARLLQIGGVDKLAPLEIVDSF